MSNEPTQQMVPDLPDVKATYVGSLPVLMNTSIGKSVVKGEVLVMLDQQSRSLCVMTNDGLASINVTDIVKFARDGLALEAERVKNNG